MINYFNLIRALHSDQYDEFTVKELKEEFNTEPDIDMEHVPIFSDHALSERKMIIGIASHMGMMIHNKSVVLIENQVKPDVLANIPTDVFPIRKIDIEPLTATTVAILNPKHNKYQKQQNNYRSRNFKK